VKFSRAAIPGRSVWSEAGRSKRTNRIRQIPFSASLSLGRTRPPRIRLASHLFAPRTRLLLDQHADPAADTTQPGKFTVPCTV
jgi:hypothetical protein